MNRIEFPDNTYPACHHSRHFGCDFDGCDYGQNCDTVSVVLVGRKVGDDEYHFSFRDGRELKSGGDWVGGCIAKSEHLRDREAIAKTIDEMRCSVEGRDGPFTGDWWAVNDIAVRADCETYYIFYPFVDGVANFWKAFTVDKEYGSLEPLAFIDDGVRAGMDGLFR